MTTPKFAYNVNELAHVTGLKARHLYDLIRDGVIPKLDLDPTARAVLVPAWALETWKTTLPHRWPGQLPEDDPRRQAPAPTGPTAA